MLNIRVKYHVYLTLHYARSLDITIIPLYRYDNAAGETDADVSLEIRNS